MLAVGEKDQSYEVLKQAVIRHPELLKIGCFGSYAGGDWGLGSDLDLVVVVAEAGWPFCKVMTTEVDLVYP